MKIIKSRKNILISWLIIAFLVGVDQITKFFAATFLKNSEPLSLIDNVFELHYLENQSAAFGVDLILIIQKIFRFFYMASLLLNFQQHLLCLSFDKYDTK